jgi:uncharacterized Zn-finger protein
MSKAKHSVHYVTCDEIGDKVKCPYCFKTYTVVNSVYKHLNGNHCAVLKEQRLVANITDSLSDKFSKMLDQRDAKQAQQTAQISEKIEKNSLVPYVDSSIHNQNLSILCVGTNDNLLDMLTASDGLPNALSYLKDCALARLSGDCRILERVYKLDTKQAAIMFANKSKTKFVYYDERQRRTVESNSTVMAKKLVGILQRSYLKGMQSFQTDMLDNDKDPDLSISQ